MGFRSLGTDQASRKSKHNIGNNSTGSEDDSGIGDIPDADVINDNKRFLCKEREEVASKL